MSFKPGDIIVKLHGDSPQYKVLAAVEHADLAYLVVIAVGTSGPPVLSPADQWKIAPECFAVGGKYRAKDGNILGGELYVVVHVTRHGSAVATWGSESGVSLLQRPQHYVRVE